MKCVFKILIILLIGMVVTDMAEADDIPFKPMQGLIVVEQASIAEVEGALRQYPVIGAPEVPGEFSLEIHPQSDGTFVIYPPDGLPAYDMINMTIWLDAPPQYPDMGYATSWVTSPYDGDEYYLEPDRSNEWGDSLIGASKKGRKVYIYIPDTGLMLRDNDIHYKPQPAFERQKNPTTIKLVLDKNTDFGNPMFMPYEIDDG